MSFGLPLSTEINRVIPKKTLIEKFSLSEKERTRFDSLIHRITIANEISPRTVNIPPGDIGNIFILRAELKEETCDARILSMLFGLIDQRMVIVLQYGIRCKPVTSHDMLIEGEWMLEPDCTLTLEGLDLDDVWENLVIRIGRIEIEEGNSLSEQISKDRVRKGREAQRAQLEKRMMAEEQPRKKRELFEQIKKLR